jgi:hypothetical protein
LSAGIGGTAPGQAAYDADGTAATSGKHDSNVDRWDTDGDALADGIEDANGDGKDSDHQLPGATETDPANLDTDADGLLDGTENRKIVAGKRGRKPCLNSAADLADPLAIDINNDGIKDGVGTGVEVVGSDRRPPGRYFTQAKAADTDGDGLTDGLEDANFNGAVDPTETDPNRCDTDNDQAVDGADTAPLNPFAGGATWSIPTPNPVVVIANPPTASNAFFSRTWPILASNSSAKSLNSFYVEITDFTWVRDYGGYSTPPGYVHPPIGADRIAITVPGTATPLPTLDNGYTLLPGSNWYQFALKNVGSSTAPGTYRGTIYFLASGRTVRRVSSHADHSVAGSEPRPRPLPMPSPCR